MNLKKIITYLSLSITITLIYCNQKKNTNNKDSFNEKLTNNNKLIPKHIKKIPHFTNSCYASSALSLFIPIFKENMNFNKLKIKKTKPLNGNDLITNSFIKIIDEMYDKNNNSLRIKDGTIKDFFDAFKNKYPFFDNSQQHDSQEFLSYLINTLQESNSLISINDELNSYDDLKPIDILKKWNNFKLRSSEIIKNFWGLFLSKIQCPKCKKKHYSYQNFIFYMSPVVMNKIEDCLNNFEEKEILTDSNKWYCTDCKDFRNAITTTKVIEYPKNLFLYLKRFNLISKEKITKEIKVKPLLKLKNINNKEFTFKLLGAIIHYGSIRGGHYVVCIYDKSINQWILVDDIGDSKIISEKEALDKISNNGYLLFYNKLK
ncbi:MAG: ubiquitin carboxyl-terminal hydrolase [Bacteroidetes bacterium]|nr:ubiquitin carboxyl-terminal hydrolase [Bacteroidota bacterium]